MIEFRYLRLDHINHDAIMFSACDVVKHPNIITNSSRFKEREISVDMTPTQAPQGLVKCLHVRMLYAQCSHVEALEIHNGACTLLHLGWLPERSPPEPASPCLEAERYLVLKDEICKLCQPFKVKTTKGGFLKRWGKKEEERENPHALPKELVDTKKLAWVEEIKLQGERRKTERWNEFNKKEEAAKRRSDELEADAKPLCEASEFEIEDQESSEIDDDDDLINQSRISELDINADVKEQDQMADIPPNYEEKRQETSGLDSSVEAEEEGQMFDISLNDDKVRKDDSDTDSSMEGEEEEESPMTEEDARKFALGILDELDAEDEADAEADQQVQ